MELNYDDYKVKASYPAKRDFVYSTTEIKTEVDENGLEFTTTIQYKKEDKGAFKKALEDYRKETSEKTELFRNDFFKYHEIENKPWKDLAFQQAWSRGHSSGYSEVINCGYEIVELCEKVEESIVNAIPIPKICL